MTLVRLDVVLAEADREGGAVGAFNVVHLENAEALVSAAEVTGLPVVLQISENCVRYHGTLAPIALATKAVAERSSALCVLHLDHAEDEELVDEAVSLGFTSVMYDGSRLDDATNRRVTRAVVERCHAAGVSVEAELGEVGGKDGVHAPSARTDPEAAAAFVAETGVDALAVAVGSSHAMTSRTAELDLSLVGRLHRAVPVPLVLHGSSGVPDDDHRGGGTGRYAEGQHRDAPQRGVHRGGKEVPRVPSRRGGHPPVPGRRSRRRCARGGTAVGAAGAARPDRVTLSLVGRVWRREQAMWISGREFGCG